MTTLKLLISALCFNLLLGCTRTPMMAPVDIQNNESSIAIKTAGGNYGYVNVITLVDGTKCATLIGISKGAIDCDWRD